MVVRIKYNNSKLGMRWIRKVYGKGKLLRTYPFNSLSKVKLKGFRLKEIKGR